MKNLVLFVFAILFLASCVKENDDYLSIADTTYETAAKSKKDKVEICHWDEDTQTFELISVNENALPAHLGHGDILPDADGDGYTAVDACTGSADDCDDTNPDVNPGATEICDNGIDDDCDGDVDEQDSDCESSNDLLTVTLPDGSTLYVMPEDQVDGTPIGNGILWGGYNIDIPGLPNIGTSGMPENDFNGAMNTEAIVTELGEGNYAAKVCADLVYAGFDDWYLPAFGELKALNSLVTPGNTNNFSSILYWSSTEFNAIGAWRIEIESGSTDWEGKDVGSIACRCVRQ